MRNNFLLVSSDSQSVHVKALMLAEEFATQENEALAISFIEVMRTRLDENHKVKFWRDLISAEMDREIENESYQKLEELLASVKIDLQSLKVLRSHRVLLLYYMYQCVALEKILAQMKKPVCVLWSANNRGSELVSCDESELHVKLSPEPIDTKTKIKLAIKAFREVFLGRHIGSIGVSDFDKSDNMHLLSVEDSGTMLNLDPAVSIAKALKRNGQNVLAITSTDFVKHHLDTHKISTWKIVQSNPTSYELLEIRRNIKRLSNQLRKKSRGITRTFVEMIVPKLESWALDMLVYEKNMKALVRKVNINHVTSVGIASPLNSFAGDFFQSRKAKWNTYFPVVFKPSIEVPLPKLSTLFQAVDKYLVYGGHLQESLIALGIDKNKIYSVGSTTFDNSKGRENEKDIEITKKQILKRWTEDKKLIVIGTEYLPRPFEEIDPVVRYLLSRNDVHVVIKVHPSDSMEMYETYVRSLENYSNIEVVGKCDLNALLNSAHLLICIVSNIVITAAVLGTPTLICDFSNKREPLDFYKEGLSVGCFKREKLNETLSELIENPSLYQRAKARVSEGIKRFNSDNDGRSAERVARLAVEL